ncbi:MAG: precorrin-8X methylmutase [Hyphomicrobiales bacterium]
MDYLRDPQAIYDRSFSIIRAEAALARLPADIEAIAIRLMHASGMTDLAADLRFDPRVGEAVRGALNAGGTVFADCEMAKAAIIARYLPAAAGIVCTLNDPRVPELAKAHGTTRSAAAVHLWQPKLEGSVVVIGNAPTALFSLLEALDAGAPKPAAIIAMPVGFVGAAESKAELAANPRGVPFVTLLGRRGGSAMAGAALNAILADINP